MGQYLGSFTKICKCDKWQDTSCFPFQKLITTVQIPLCFRRHLDQKKNSCFVRNNAYKVVGMDLIAAHAMEHSSLNLHNGNTQNTGLSSVDTTLQSKQTGQHSTKATCNEDPSLSGDTVKIRQQLLTMWKSLLPPFSVYSLILNCPQFGSCKFLQNVTVYQSTQQHIL